MPVDLLVSMVFSLHCISNRTFASCSCIGNLLLLGTCGWKLELSRNTGSRGFASNGGWDLSCALSLLDCGEPMFCTTYSALSTLVMEPKTVFFQSLTTELIVFSRGTNISWGCLCWILCKTSKGISPLGSCLSKVIPNKLFTCIFLGVFTKIQVIDLPCNVHWPFVITNCFDACGVILKARNFFLIVRKCLPSLFYVQLIL